LHGALVCYLPQVLASFTTRRFFVDGVVEFGREFGFKFSLDGNWEGEVWGIEQDRPWSL